MLGGVSNNKDLQSSANVCKRLQSFANVCKRLQTSANVCKCLQTSTHVCKHLQMSANVCKRLQTSANIAFGPFNQSLMVHLNVLFNRYWYSGQIQYMCCTRYHCTVSFCKIPHQYYSYLPVTMNPYTKPVTKTS